MHLRTEYKRVVRQRTRLLLINEAGGQCIYCGYDKSVAALHFHHRESAAKDFELAHKLMDYDIATLRREADKCDLLCANCHAELHEDDGEREKHDPIDDSQLVLP